MSATARPWLAVLALAVACALPTGPAFAGDDAPAVPRAPSDRDRAVAAALESANIRMRAKVDEAAILDRQGRHDEALAALRAVETIHREGLAIVERLSAPAVSAAAPVLRPVPGTPRRLRPRVEPPMIVTSTPPRHVASATAYLLGAQRPDGWFRSDSVLDVAPGVDLGEGHDVPATALAVVALLDSLDDNLEPVRARNAADRGVAALVAAQAASGAFGDGRDLEAHALASWAIAAGAARLAPASWRPAAQSGIAKAVTFALSRRDARGLWSAGTSSTDDDWVLSAWMVTALHEIAALPRSFVRDVDLGVVLTRARLGAHEAWMGGVAATGPAARFARALLLEKPSPEESGLLPRLADDEVTLLFGTTLRFGRSFGFEAWSDEALSSSQQRQYHDGPLAGSWDPSGDAGTRPTRHGRTFATACRLLAALVPVVPYREPAGD